MVRNTPDRPRHDQRFIQAEVVPRIEAIEHGGEPPYDVLRKMLSVFGLRELAAARFAHQIAKEKERAAKGEATTRVEGSRKRGPEAADDLALQIIPIIELCRHSPGMVTAMGASMGLTANAIMGRGTIAQKERWALPLLTFEKIGAWAITEPGSGSDAFGAMASVARRDGQGYRLSGSKTFITNGPYADTIVFICKLDDGSPPKDRKVLSFVLDKGMPGLTQSKPLRKMGLHGSPTGELFLDDVSVGKDRLLGGDRGSPVADVGQGHLRHRAHRGGRGVRSASSSSAAPCASNTRRPGPSSESRSASFS